MPQRLDRKLQQVLRRGVVIPAHPLALTSERRLDERRQRALTRYYLSAGAGGVAVGVHTTQFAIHDAKTGLLQPVLQLAAGELDQADARRPEPTIRIGGVCGSTRQAADEARLLADLKYSVALLSLAALRGADESALLAHCKEIAEILPVMGFYLQPAVGGRVLSYKFWLALARIENVVAIKIAPFNRYQTLEVVRAVAESGRDDLALYTGNDDNIVMDLLTPYVFQVRDKRVERRMVGGLLGHWAVWTRRAVELLAECHAATCANNDRRALERKSVAVTDCNAAFFDAANHFAGCVAGLHEVLRRQGLLEGIWCLDPNESLGPGQREEIDRVYSAYPHLNDDDFVRENLDRWLRP
jgi:dihydrodipicolinate synthase/N-acetylneuraminate lyase